jgi:hypothetical protein
MKNKKKFHDYETAFRQQFNRPLNQFWDPFTGFDVIAFDEVTAPPDGTSLKDFLVTKYSQEASDLIGKLLS